jgi:hypothetical protein
MKNAAVLHSHWKPGPSPGEIVGEWAEDGSPYRFTVPVQLCDEIIAIQNALSVRYQELDSLRRKVDRMEHENTLLGL